MDLVDIVLEGAKAVTHWIIELFMTGIQSGYQSLSVDLFNTPTPETGGPFVLGPPTNAPWMVLHDKLVGGEIMLVSLLLLVIAVQGRHTVRIFNVGSAYEARKTKQTAPVGAFLIVTWYWIAVTILYLVDGFSVALMTDLTLVTEIMRQFLEVQPSNTAVVLLLAVAGGIAMWLLEAIFYIRMILLYVYLYGMPIALALAYSQLPVLSSIARGFSERFIPLAILPLPIAVLFRGYDLLFASHTVNPSAAFLKMIVAVSLPIIALYIAWKTFTYAAPLTAGVIGTTAKGTALVGGLAAATYIGGAGVATTATRWGPTAAAGQAVAERATVTDGSRHSGSESPAYRRTENDPVPQ